MPTATISSKTTLGEILKKDQEGAMNVLTQFGIIHCAHCEIDEAQTLDAACKEAGAPTKAVVNALKAL
jgi:hypothetical protein